MAMWPGRGALATVIVLVMLVAGCTRPVPVDRGSLQQVGLASALQPCCVTRRKVPPAVTKAAESCARTVVGTIQQIRTRDGFLEDKPEAQQLLLSKAEPLDMWAVSYKGRASGQLGMGYFTHFSVFVGDEAALRARGVWDDPVVRPWHDRLRQGPMVIEAMSPSVALADAETMFQADAVALLRPTGLSRARDRQALRDLFRKIGTPFDHHFDARTKDEVFCTELPAQVLPELHLPLREAYGRPSYIPDEVVAQTLLGKLPLRLVSYVLADRRRWQEAGPVELTARILAYWPESQRGE